MGLARRGHPGRGVLRRAAGIPESLRACPAATWWSGRTQLPAHPDLLVSLDVGSAERLGSLARLLDTCRQSLVIDHHPSNTRFGQFHLVDAERRGDRGAGRQAAGSARDCRSTGRSRRTCTPGLATDTGHFRHADSAAHLLAARLIDAGVRPAEVMYPITESHPFGWLGMLSDVLGGAVLDREAAQGRGLVYTVIDDVDPGRPAPGGARFGDRHPAHRAGGGRRRGAEADRRAQLAGVPAVAASRIDVAAAAGRWAAAVMSAPRDSPTTAIRCSPSMRCARCSTAEPQLGPIGGRHDRGCVGLQA